MANIVLKDFIRTCKWGSDEEFHKIVTAQKERVVATSIWVGGLGLPLNYWGVRTGVRILKTFDACATTEQPVKGREIFTAHDFVSENMLPYWEHPEVIWMFTITGSTMLCLKKGDTAWDVKNLLSDYEFSPGKVLSVMTSMLSRDQEVVGNRYYVITKSISEISQEEKMYSVTVGNRSFLFWEEGKAIYEQI